MIVAISPVAVIMVARIVATFQLLLRVHESDANPVQGEKKVAKGGSLGVWRACARTCGGGVACSVCASGED